MTNPLKINIASEFSRFPSGRTAQDSAYSGQAFREKFLVPNLRAGRTLQIELDGPLGYGSSFLEEAFGGLIRVSKFEKSFIFSNINLITYDESLVEEIYSYINNA